MADFSELIPARIDFHPSVNTVIVHTGTNDELESLSSTIESLGRHRVLSGLIPTLSGSTERFSRLFKCRCRIFPPLRVLALLATSTISGLGMISLNLMVYILTGKVRGGRLLILFISSPSALTAFPADPIAASWSSLI